MRMRTKGGRGTRILPQETIKTKTWETRGPNSITRLRCARWNNIQAKRNIYNKHLMFMPLTSDVSQTVAMLCASPPHTHRMKFLCIPWSLSVSMVENAFVLIGVRFEKFLRFTTHDDDSLKVLKVLLLINVEFGIIKRTRQAGRGWEGGKLKCWVNLVAALARAHFFPIQPNTVIRRIGELMPQTGQPTAEGKRRRADNVGEVKWAEQKRAERRMSD